MTNPKFKYSAFNYDGSVGYAASTLFDLIDMIAHDGVSPTDYTFFELGRQMSLKLEPNESA